MLVLKPNSNTMAGILQNQVGEVLKKLFQTQQ